MSYSKDGGFAMKTMNTGLAKRVLRLTLGILMGCALFQLCSAQTQPAPTPSNAVVADASKPAVDGPQFKSRSPRYRIEPGDTFDLTFDLSPEFNQLAVAVQPDGFASLRAVGDIKVSGQTVPELTQTLRLAYEKILNNPVVSI